MPKTTVSKLISNASKFFTGVGNSIKTQWDEDMATMRKNLGIYTGAPTDNNPLVDLKNKIEVQTSTTAFNKSGAATRQALYNAYQTGGYKAFKKLKNQFYSSKPQVYESDLGPANELYNARYKVNTIKDRNTLNKITQSAANGTLELRILDDKGLRNAYDSVYGTRNMSRNKLTGINSKDRYVLYDTTTGQYYRYRNEDDADYKQIQEELQSYENLYEAQMAHLEAVQEFYLGELSKQTGARYAATYENYAKDYERAVLAVNETSNKLVELRAEVNPNDDFRNKINEQLDQYEAQRNDYNKYTKYIADFDDPTQFNSLSDLLKELAHDTDKKPWIDNLQELLGYGFGYIGSDELTGSQKLRVGLQNALVNFGETMDIIATPVKAILNADNRGMSKVDALKATVGLYGDGGYYNFDYDTGFLPADLILEVFSDPMTYVTFGAKAIAETAITPIAKTVGKSFADIGIDISDDVLEYASKMAVRNAQRTGKALEETTKEAVQRVLAKQDTHRALAELGDNTLPFLEADRAAKMLFERGYIGNTNKTLKQMYKLLEGTNLTQEQMNKVIKLSIKSWETLSDTAAKAAKLAAEQKATRVVAAAQLINKADDSYARIVRKLTITPFTLPFDGLNTISKWVTGSSLPNNVKTVVSNIWNSAKRVEAKTPVHMEAELLRLSKLADTTVKYAKELNLDDTVVEELSEVQQRALAQTYNIKVSTLLSAFDSGVKSLLSASDLSTLTRKDVHDIFDAVARKITNDEFDYAGLFAFISNESSFAKMLNDANINAYKSLNRLRNIASERAVINSSKELFKNVANAIEMLNKIKRDFNTEYGNDIPMRGVENTYSTLKQFINSYDFGEEMDAKMLDLDNIVHDLRWYTDNDDIIPAALTDNLFLTLNDINDIALDKLYYKLHPERGVEVTRDLEKAMGIPIPVDAPALDTTVNIIRKIFKDADNDIELSMQEINSLILTELDKNKLPNATDDWMRISVSNVARKLALYNNPFIINAINSATDVSTPLGTVIDAVTSLLDDDATTNYAIKRGAATLQTYKLEQIFMDDLSTALGSNAYLAVQDTLTDEVLRSANGFVRNMDCTSAASIELATSQITQRVIAGAQEHMQGLADDINSVALMHNLDTDGNYFTMNGVNTAENVRNMMHASSDSLAKGRAAIADDNYRDIYYSITHTSKDGNPISISFGDGVTGEIQTFTLRVADDTFNISDDTARKLFGLSDATEFKKQVAPLMKDAYKNTQKYYEAINEYLSTVLAHTTDGKQIRFVGFNTGITRTNQEAVFKHVRNAYNMVMGPFVDLGEEIRKIQFPNMYLSDAEAENLEMAIRKHVNNIAKTQVRYDSLELRFGNTAEDLTSPALTLIADDALRYMQGGTTKDIPSIAITNMLKDNNQLPQLYNQAQDLKKAVVYSRAAVKRLDVPDDLKPLVNMSRLKEMYELKTGNKLNVMNVLRRVQGKNVNIRYVYRADEAKRWFKTDYINSLNAQMLDELHKAYKSLISYEQRIKEINIANMFTKKECTEAFRTMLNNVKPRAKYDPIYGALKQLDFAKMSNNQTLAAMFALRKYVDMHTDDIAQNIGEDLYYILENYRGFLTKGVDIVRVEDTAKYNKFNTLYNIYDYTNSAKRDLDAAYDDVRAVESYMRLIDRNYGRTTEGVELAAMHSISSSVKKLSKEYDKLVNAVHTHAVYENGGIIKSKQMLKAEAKLRKFRDRLDRYSENVAATTVANLNKMTNEQLVAHLIGNCSGTLVLQLDSKVLGKYTTHVESLIKKVSDNPMFECTYKELPINGAAHPAFIISAAIPNSANEIRNAIKLVDELPISKNTLPMRELVDNLPNRFALSDYTPANAEATRRVLEFAGKAKNDANDIVQLYQKLKVFDAGCNNNVIGDHVFVKQFYPQKANNYMKTVQQMIVHNMNHIGQLTYYTTIIKQGMFSLDKFKYGDVSADKFAELLNKNKYVVCELDNTGAPVLVKFTQDVYNNASQYSCVPEEWFISMQDAWESFKNKDIIDNRSSAAYKQKMVSYTYSDLINLRKQGWLFTNTATPNNNLIGGATNFISDTGFSGVKALLTNFYSWLTYQRVYRDIQDTTAHITNDAVTDATITEYFKHGRLKNLMDETTFRNHLQVTLTSGGVSDEAFVKMLESQPAKLVNEAVKYSGLELDDMQLAEFTDYVRAASVDMNKIFNKHYDRVNEVYDYVAIQKSLNEYLSNSDSKWAEYLQPVAMQFMSKRDQLLDITKIPVLGKYYKFNQDMFGNIESYLRDTAAMYYMQNGLAPKDAINEMLRTQFDYSESGALIDALNIISPFFTYKLKNLNYWLLDGNTKATAIRFASNLGEYQGIVDPMELAKTFYWSEYYKEHPEENENDGSVLEQLTEGYTANAMYQSANGKWKISKNHYLKNSAPFFEAAELWMQALTAMTDYERFKEFLTSNIYTPYTTTATFITDLINGEVDEQYYADHYYEINDMVPVFGTLVNSIIGKAKAADANNISVTDIKALYAFGEKAAENTIDAVLDVLAVTWSSMIGTSKEKKPVGYMWNQQSDEYKATHRFVFGVSALPAQFTKDPAKYVDHLGSLIELGYSKEEALELLTKGWYFDADGNVHQYNIYEDTEMPDMFKYDADVFDNTLRYLLERGYDIDSAYTYMKTFGKWVDENGEVRGMDDVELLWKSSMERDRYYKLPAYIRNIPNQYSAQLKYYKEQGYTAEEAKLQMQTNALFITEDGTTAYLTPEQVSELNSMYKYNPKYQQDAEAGQAAHKYTERSVTSLNKLNTYSTPDTERTEGGRQYQASSYPARYRRPKKVHHSFTYNTIYGLNNIARNRMTVAMSHTHYRSANRYRAEAVRNRFRYL